MMAKPKHVPFDCQKQRNVFVNKNSLLNLAAIDQEFVSTEDITYQLLITKSNVCCGQFLQRGIIIRQPHLVARALTVKTELDCH
jgi:hypothetical protein